MFGSQSSGYDHMTPTAFLQETGLKGNFAQGLGAKSEGATLANRQSQAQGAQIAGIESMVIPVWPGGTYQARLIAAASPASISYGFYARVHLLGADASGNPDASTDTTFELLGDVTKQPGISSLQNPGAAVNAVAPASQGWAIQFQVPLSGASFAVTSVGNSVLSQTINFTPSFLYIEIVNWDPVSSTSGTAFVIVDGISLIDLTDGAQGNSASSFQGAWNAATAYVPGQQTSYQGTLWVSRTNNTNSVPSTSSTDWSVAVPTGKVTATNSSNQVTTDSVQNNSITNSATYVDSSAGNAVNATVGAELQIGSVTISAAGGAVVVLAKCDVTTTGTSTDQAALRVRKVSITGALLDESDFPVVAETTNLGVVIGIDSSPSASQTYILTLAVNSATETWGNVRITALNLKK